jgi:hypothetical protein
MLLYVNVKIKPLRLLDGAGADKMSTSAKTRFGGDDVMTLNRMTSLWARTALCWFLAALCFGLYLGATGQFQYGSSHAHVGLLGWVSSGLFALLYTLVGGEATRGARLHWAAHNLGTLGMAGGLYLVIRTGNDAFGALIGLCGLLILLATMWLIASFWARLAPR